MLTQPIRLITRKSFEGFNNKIKVAKRIGYGCKNMMNIFSSDIQHYHLYETALSRDCDSGMLIDIKKDGRNSAIPQ